MRSIIIASLVVWAGGMSQAATAQDLSTSNNSLIRSGGMTIQEVAAIFDAQGYDAEVSSETELSANARAYEFNVLGYNCNGVNRCTEFLLITGYDLPNGFPLEKINDWNVSQPAGRAFLDEDGDPFLDHTISVSGPADTGAFIEGLILWLSALHDYNEFLDQHIAQA